MKQPVDRPIRLGMHTYTLHFFGFGESWGFGKDYYFDQVMSLYELMDWMVCRSPRSICWRPARQIPSAQRI